MFLSTKIHFNAATTRSRDQKFQSQIQKGGCEEDSRFHRQRSGKLCPFKHSWLHEDADKAWRDVTQKLSNCFGKAGFVKKAENEKDLEEVDWLEE